MVCATSNFPCIHRALAEGVILQEGPGMKKTFAVFVVVATIAGSLAATPASAQRGVAAGVSVPYYPGPGRYDFGSCEWVTQRFWDGHGWRVRRVRVCF
jgi:hypothetical protein